MIPRSYSLWHRFCNKELKIPKALESLLLRELFHDNSQAFCLEIQNSLFTVKCVLRSVRICRIRCWCLFFLFETINNLLRQIDPKYQNFLFKTKFKRTEFNKGVNFSCFRPLIPFMDKQIQKLKFAYLK